MAETSSASNVKSLFTEAPSGPAVEDMGPTMQEMVTMLAHLCGTRVMGLLAVIGAIAIFSYAVIDPAPWRTITATSFAITALLPVVILYLRKG